jgi:hypothetical protein
MTAVAQEHLAELTQWAYRNGATDVAPDCEAVCSELWLAEHRPMPNQATSSELWAELTSLEEAGVAEEGIGLLPSLADAIPTIALGAGAFTLGWHIGGQIDKWLGINVPEEPTTTESVWLLWIPAGETWPFLTYHEVVRMPYSGYIAFTSGLWGIVAQSRGGVCPGYGSPTPPDGFTQLSWWWNDCFNGYGNPNVPTTAYGFVVKPESALAQPLQDYTGQHVDEESPPVRDPGVETVERRLQEALESGSYPLLNQWLDHQLGGGSDDPRCEPVAGARAIDVPSIMPGQTVGDYEDCLDTLELTEHVRVTVPVGKAVLAQPARGVVGVDPAEGTSVELESETQVEIALNPETLPDPSRLDRAEDCALSGGEYPVSPPANDPTPEAFDQITDSALVERPTFLSLHGSTLLRWGSVSLDTEAEPIDYPGWGYQHVKAKHGWSRADEAATRAALLTSAFPNRRTADSWDYIGPEYAGGRVTCVREVVVNHARTGEEPGARGIITSYGRPLASLPGFMRPN